MLNKWQEMLSEIRTKYTLEELIQQTVIIREEVNICKT